MKAKNDKPVSYWKFIVGKEQFTDWVAIFATTLICCLIVLRFVPFPGTITDSFGYLSCAANNQFIPFRPFGYSAFLQFVHLFSDSIYSIIISQALVYSITLTLLALAVKKYWGAPKKGLFITLEVLIALNFNAIYMLDTIMSDSLLCGMIFLILAMLMVWINEKSWISLIIYILAFFVSLHTRYSAMFIPIAVIPVLLLNGSRAMRIISSALTVAAFLVFNSQVKDGMEQSVKIRQFSTGFDGWQLANNGMHVLPYITANDGMPEDKQLTSIHNYCVDNFDELISSRTRNGKGVTAALIWDAQSPLKQMLYMDMDNRKTYYLDSWVRLGSGPYADYGKWLILHFPGKFIRYYLLPNMKSMFLPFGLEIEAGYQTIPAGKTEVTDWFDVPKDKDFEARSQGFYKHISPVLPWIELLTWIVFLTAAVLLFVKSKWSEIPAETKLCIALVLLFGFIHYGTTTFASPIAIRYWMPMHSVKLLFAWIALRQSKIL